MINKEKLINKKIKKNKNEIEEKKDTKYFSKKLNNIKYSYKIDDKRTIKIAQNNTINPILMEIIVNDRMGQRVRIKCRPEDKISDLKKLVSAKIGTKWQKIKIQKGYLVLKDNISLEDYEIKEGVSLEMYYN